MTKIIDWAGRNVWIGWLLAIPFLLQGVIWLTDRAPPFSVIGPVVVSNARPGEIIYFTAPVRRDLDRECSVMFSRHIIDVRGIRFELTKEPGVMTAAGLRAMDAAMGKYLRLAVEVPEQAAPGQAAFVTELSYACNPVHRAWPIEVSMPLLFLIQP